MNEDYELKLEKASKMLCKIFANDIEDFINKGTELDAEILEMGRATSRKMLEKTYEEIAKRLSVEAKSEGYRMERNPIVSFKTILGEVRIHSPYLWKAGGVRGVRPMRKYMGITGNCCSERLKRALVDFGIEKSFERAASRFVEHYGWEVSVSTIMRHTEKVAQEAEIYFDKKLSIGEHASSSSVSTMIAELDGCEIRTGVFTTAKEAGQKEKPPDKRVRQERWREVRTGFVRPLKEVTKTYVCKMASYPDICQQLYAASRMRGLDAQTRLISPGDGGNGLQEELSVHFSTLQYILDHRHLESHFYETAEALGIEQNLKKGWVKQYMDQLWENNIAKVLKQLSTLYKANKNERLRRLIGYLTRFKDAVDYGRFRSNDWPVGSGEVESAHRYIPQERLKIAGACWHPNTINPMLSMRVVRANLWWEDFWQWRQSKKMEIAA